MANDFTEVAPRILAAGLRVLRENVITARVVNSSYSEEAGEKGSTVDVTVPAAIAATSVTPAAYAPNPADLAPTSVPIVMDQWYEAAFYLTDKDLLTIQDGFLPRQAESAVKGLANVVDAYLLGFYKYFYGYRVPSAGGIFADASGNATLTDAIQARRLLNTQLAPLDDRYLLMDPVAEAAALGNRAIQDMSFSGDAAGLTEGKINRKLGLTWLMNQNIPSHVAGTITGTISVGAAASLGAKVAQLDAGAGEAIAMKIGDVFTFSGQTQQYVVTANLTVGASASGNVAFEPGLAVALAGAETITMVSTGTKTQNLVIHRDAIGFATRPLVRHGPGLGVVSESMVDPISGLTMRLEIKHEHRRVRYSYDMLYGAAVLRRELGVRVGGAA
jgi:hypothetical protein